MILPIKFYLSGPTPNTLHAISTFEHSGLSISISLPESEALSIESAEVDNRYFRTIENIDLMIDEIPVGHPILSSLPPNDVDAKVVFCTLLEISNRIIRNIRNLGFLIKLREYHADEKEPEYLLTKWKVEYLPAGGEWTRVVVGDIQKGLLQLMYAQKYGDNLGNLNVLRWPLIEEAIIDDIDPPPEQEFVANTIEHLNDRNYRLAVLESIICLEIVLNQFLRLFLAIQHSLSKTKINKFLDPSFGLSSKIAGLLNICISNSELKHLDMQKVSSAITMRNKIVHGTGRLPSSSNEGEIRSCVGEVLSLVYLLAKKRDELKLTPELSEIASSIQEKCNIPKPRIIPRGSHRRIVNITYLFERPLPSKSDVKNIIESLIEAFSEVDDRFDPVKHLFVRVRNVKELLAMYTKGSLSMHEHNEPAS